MMLAATTDKFQLTTDSSANIDVHVNFIDASISTGDFSNGGKQNTAIASATTTDILAAPGASTLRRAKLITIRNKHASTPNTVTVIFDQNGTDFEIHQVTLEAGEMLQYVEGIGWEHVRNVPEAESLWKILTSDATGQNVNTAQPWFPTAGGVLVAAGTLYSFEGVFHSTRAAGTTSHTTGFGFGGTATITEILTRFNCGEGDVATLADDDSIMANSAANLQVKAASTSATENIKLSCEGTVLINAAGTFIPQFTYSAAPGGAPTIQAGSRFRMDKRANNQQGVWS